MFVSEYVCVLTFYKYVHMCVLYFLELKELYFVDLLNDKKNNKCIFFLSVKISYEDRKVTLPSLLLCIGALDYK